MKNLKLHAVLVLSILFLHGCNDTDVKPRPVLVKAEHFKTLRADILQAAIESAEINLDADQIKYDVEVYKIVYRTKYKNEEIEASGLMILPLVESNEAVGMVSFQHGTIVAHEDAPSMILPGDQVVNLYAALASPGFIVVIPDLIGFGASSHIPHPYYVEEATATAIIDNLNAVKEFASQHDINFNEKLFLAGYSQGGYATLAAHKAIEQNGLDGFDLQASFPAAGGYNVKGMQEYFFGLENYHEPFYITYVAHAYTTYYGWAQPYSNFFNEPYASKIPNLFNGSKTAGEINAALTENIPALIKTDLLEDIDQAQYDYIKNAFIENSLVDFVPEIPVYLYHGDADITVPYQNSVSSLNEFLQNGTSQENISLTTLPGADHGSGVFPYIEHFVPILISLK